MLSKLDSLQAFRTHPYRAKYLKPYAAQMNHDRDHVIVDENVRRVLTAQGFDVREEPRSIFSIEKLFEALGKFSPGRVNDPNQTDAIKSGIALAEACFKWRENFEKLDAMELTIGNLVALTSNVSASAGLTAFGYKKGEVVERAFESATRILEGLKVPEPCIAYSRTQFHGKTRLVWGYPYSMTALEGLIARPLIDVFKKGFTPMAFAMSTGSLGTLLRVSSYRKRFAYSVDMSSYDSSISSFLINRAFDILESWFDLDQKVYNDISVRDLFSLVRRYFVCTPIVMPDLNLYLGKKHGVPSGSYFTQIIDSIVNVIICGTISAHYNLNVDKRDILVLGDDLIFWSNRDVNLKDIADFAAKQFGVQFNAEKSRKYYHDEEIHFLGRNWKNGIPDIPREEILIRAVYPETYREYSSDAVERRRQVALLFFSHAIVYKSAWLIFQDLEANPRMFHWTLTTIERGCRSVMNLHNPDHLSGLTRFMLKFHTEPGYLKTPLGLLFWS